jgi:hypothetical protein
MLVLPIYSSAESLYFETGWSKLEDRRKSRKLNLFYKIEKDRLNGFFKFGKSG